MDFYHIDEKYIKFLQQYEKQKRGITKVPNIKYSDHNKFAFGAVMKINDIHYYVSVSIQRSSYYPTVFDSICNTFTISGLLSTFINSSASIPDAAACSVAEDVSF